MAASSFPFPNLDTLPAELRQEVLNRRSLSVYRMIMHTPGIAPSFLGISDALRQCTTLPGNWRELAILRVGHRYHAPYELHHHDRIAHSVGMGDAAIAAAQPGADDAALDKEEKLMLRLTDELLDVHRLSPASRDLALTVLSTNQLADLVLTVGFYQLVCNFLNTFGVPVED
jgi:4-carboxymuconolactone decarboxylase